MKEKYNYINPNLARELINKAMNNVPSKKGVNSKVYILDDYVVLESSNLNVRNVTVPDDDFIHYDKLIHTLMDLHNQGVSAVPILGYSYELKEENGIGFVIQEKATGTELYDDSMMAILYGKRNKSFLETGFDSRMRDYWLHRTKELSRAPQEHFDKFISDIKSLIENHIQIDFYSKSNFFYDKSYGFQFIDLASHTDYYYGLSDEKIDSNEIASCFGFLPCHIDSNSKILSHLSLKEDITKELLENDYQTLIEHNKKIFKKCKTGMINNGISIDQINESLKKIRLFGIS